MHHRLAVLIAGSSGMFGCAPAQPPATSATASTAAPVAPVAAEVPPARDEAPRAIPAAPGTFRVATFNTSLNDNADGGLVRRLSADDDHAKSIAAILQRVRPDLVLLNEFDYDAAGEAADLFVKRYLGVAQPRGGEPLAYPYRYVAPVNTGVPSGIDFDGDGTVDNWGFGHHPGQYGMLVLSRFPIDPGAVRTFQLLRWSKMPGAITPIDPQTHKPWYTAKAWSQVRLSSKSHWDIPVQTPQGAVHFLVAHPTPPTFDGPEDRNGARNHDEIRFWAEYLSRKKVPWLCDDKGVCGGLTAGPFVIAGDMNADPLDGDARPDAIPQLLAHPRVTPDAPPRSEGAVAVADLFKLSRRGETAEKTAVFGPKVGTLRLDYILPSREVEVAQKGVFWPLPKTPDEPMTRASDHHAVWLDLRLPHAS